MNNRNRATLFDLQIVGLAVLQDVYKRQNQKYGVTELTPKQGELILVHRDSPRGLIYLLVPHKTVADFREKHIPISCGVKVTFS